MREFFTLLLLFEKKPCGGKKMAMIWTYIVFVVLLVGMIFSFPIAIVSAIESYHEGRPMFALGTLGIPFIIYVCTCGQMASSCYSPDNYKRTKLLLIDLGKIPLANILSLGLYNSLILYFILEPWNQWFSFIPSVSTLPIVNYKHYKTLLDNQRIKKNNWTKEEIKSLYLKGQLMPSILESLSKSSGKTS